MRLSCDELKFEAKTQPPPFFLPSFLLSPQLKNLRTSELKNALASNTAHLHIRFMSNPPVDAHQPQLLLLLPTSS